MASTDAAIVDLIKRYITRLNQHNISVQKVLLFGSYSKGKSRVDSDIDIAVISPDFEGNRYSDRRRIVPFRRGIDSRIDPIPFTPEEFAAGGKNTGSGFEDYKFTFQAKFSRSLRDRLVRAALAYVPSNGGRLNSYSPHRD